MTLSLGRRTLLLTWLSPRQWREGEVRGRWAGTDAGMERDYLYARLCGLEVSLCW